MKNNLNAPISKDIMSLSAIYDKENMHLAIQSFSEQIKKSKKIMKNRTFSIKENINNVIICGMGGSAIGGDFCKSLLGSEININIYVNRAYSLPAWASENSLIIISSYSGNTEETISCYKECISKSFNPVIISTGGFILNSAKENNNMYIEVPSGYQPRAALGFSFSLILLTLHKFNLISNNNIFIDQINNLISSVESFSLSMYSNDNPAYKLAKEIASKFVIIYSTQILESVAYRFRCQLAENSKIISSHFIFPEQNHNEIEAFQNLNIDNIAFVWLVDNEDLTQNIHRMKITRDILKNSGCHFDIEIDNSLNRYDRILKMANYVDWVSYYCALVNKTDPTPVNKIKKLKLLL